MTIVATWVITLDLAYTLEQGATEQIKRKTAYLLDNALI